MPWIRARDYELPLRQFGYAVIKREGEMEIPDDPEEINYPPVEDDMLPRQDLRPRDDSTLEKLLDGYTVSPLISDRKLHAAFATMRDNARETNREAYATAKKHVEAFRKVYPELCRPIAPPPKNMWPASPNSWRATPANVAKLEAEWRAMQRQNIVSSIGAFFFEYFRASAQMRGAYKVAKQMRKQGYPLSVALMILGRR